MDVSSEDSDDQAYALSEEGHSIAGTADDDGGDADIPSDQRRGGSGGGGGGGGDNDDGMPSRIFVFPLQLDSAQFAATPPAPQTLPKYLRHMLGLCFSDADADLIHGTLVTCLQHVVRYQTQCKEALRSTDAYAEQSLKKACNRMERLIDQTENSRVATESNPMNSALRAEFHDKIAQQTRLFTKFPNLPPALAQRHLKSIDPPTSRIVDRTNLAPPNDLASTSSLLPSARLPGVASGSAAGAPEATAPSRALAPMRSPIVEGAFDNDEDSVMAELRAARRAPRQGPLSSGPLHQLQHQLRLSQAAANAASTPDLPPQTMHPHENAMPSRASAKRTGTAAGARGDSARVRELKRERMRNVNRILERRVRARRLSTNVDQIITDNDSSSDSLTTDDLHGIFRAYARRIADLQNLNYGSTREAHSQDTHEVTSDATSVMDLWPEDTPSNMAHTAPDGLSSIRFGDDIPMNITPNGTQDVLPTIPTKDRAPVLLGLMMEAMATLAAKSREFERSAHQPALALPTLAPPPPPAPSVRQSASQLPLYRWSQPSPLGSSAIDPPPASPSETDSLLGGNGL